MRLWRRGAYLSISIRRVSILEESVVISTTLGSFMWSAKNIANLLLLLIGRVDLKIRKFASDHHGLL
jgi:hypothetical protein